VRVEELVPERELHRIVGLLADENRDNGTREQSRG
jgi:hypothetical protein